MRYILAFDVGTTAIKAVCIDQKTGEFTTAKSDCALYFPAPNAVEQDPLQLWDALCAADAVYSKAFSAYRKLYSALTPIYDELNGTY